MPSLGTALPLTVLTISVIAYQPLKDNGPNSKTTHVKTLAGGFFNMPSFFKMPDLSNVKNFHSSTVKKSEKKSSANEQSSKKISRISADGRVETHEEAKNVNEKDSFAEDSESEYERKEDASGSVIESNAVKNVSSRDREASSDSLDRRSIVNADGTSYMLENKTNECEELQDRLDQLNITQTAKLSDGSSAVVSSGHDNSASKIMKESSASELQSQEYADGSTYSEAKSKEDKMAGRTSNQHSFDILLQNDANGNSKEIRKHNISSDVKMKSSGNQMSENKLKTADGLEKRNRTSSEYNSRVNSQKRNNSIVDNEVSGQNFSTILKTDSMENTNIEMGGKNASLQTTKQNGELVFSQRDEFDTCVLDNKEEARKTENIFANDTSDYMKIHNLEDRRTNHTGGSYENELHDRYENDLNGNVQTDTHTKGKTNEFAKAEYQKKRYSIIEEDVNNMDSQTFKDENEKRKKTKNLADGSESVDVDDKTFRENGTNQFKNYTWNRYDVNGKDYKTTIVETSRMNNKLDQNNDTNTYKMDRGDDGYSVLNGSTSVQNKDDSDIDIRVREVYNKVDGELTIDASNSETAKVNNARTKTDDLISDVEDAQGNKNFSDVHLREQNRTDYDLFQAKTNLTNVGIDGDVQMRSVYSNWTNNRTGHDTDELRNEMFKGKDGLFENKNLEKSRRNDTNIYAFEGAKQNMTKSSDGDVAVDSSVSSRRLNSTAVNDKEHLLLEALLKNGSSINHEHENTDARNHTNGNFKIDLTNGMQTADGDMSVRQRHQTYANASDVNKNSASLKLNNRGTNGQFEIVDNFVENGDNNNTFAINQTTSQLDNIGGVVYQHVAKADTLRARDINEENQNGRVQDKANNTYTDSDSDVERTDFNA
ncbi:unnamed protein product [Caenorhabditis bovis]|uniref:Uncharacterized protein n=1 Tax=Caenorhabditis bovis TaxID=2654633 RepID=A0A8S1EKK0_9PELO|nr:unnamed protein product [Caenorhabditis bovis]